MSANFDDAFAWVKQLATDYKANEKFNVLTAADIEIVEEVPPCRD